MSNADGRQNGAEKAEQHLMLSYIYVSSVALVTVDKAMRMSLDDGNGSTFLYRKIHDATQKLTSYMDEEIGFPLVGRPDYDKLAPLFFDKFIKLADEEFARL